MWTSFQVWDIFLRDSQKKIALHCFDSSVFLSVKKNYRTYYLMYSNVTTASKNAVVTHSQGSLCQSQADTPASQKDKCDSLQGLRRPANFLQTPLPLCASWCYHNPGPREDLCGSWPRFPLAHVCVTLSAERPDAASCQAEEELSSNVGNRKRKRTRAGLGERIVGTGNSIYSSSPWMIFKQLSQVQTFAYFKGSFVNCIICWSHRGCVDIVYYSLLSVVGAKRLTGIGCMCMLSHVHMWAYYLAAG